VAVERGLDLYFHRRLTFYVVGVFVVL